MDRSLHRPCDQASTHSVDTAALREDPVAIASGVCWVGVRLAHGHFQCHTCFLANGSANVLIDPGSPLTIVGSLAKLRAITDLDAIRCSSVTINRPTSAAPCPGSREVLRHPDVQVVTEWRANALIRHDGHGFSTYLVEQHGWSCPWRGTGTLFSSDPFGGFVPDSSVLGRPPADASRSAWG